MLLLVFATFQKCSALQSTTILRLPTPRKPPKSITAPRTAPLRSTMTSTIRPIFSLAALLTSRPRMPWASTASITVTEGGAAGAAGAGASGFGDACAGLVAGGEPGAVCGETVSPARQELPPQS